MQLIKSSLCLAFVILGVAASRAATYYVATNGNDTAAGKSPDAPLRTLSKAVSLMSSGDTLLASAGSYLEALSISKPNITIDGQNVAATKRVSISASNVIVRNFVLGTGNRDGYGDGACVRVLTGADHSSVQNCTIFSQVGQNQYGVSWINGNVTGFTVADCLMTNFGPNSVCVILGGTNSQVLRNRLFDNLQAEAAFYIWGVSNRIANNIVSNLNETGGGGGHPDIFQTFPSGAPSYGHVIEQNLIMNSTCQIGSLQSATSGDSTIDTRIRDWTFQNNVFIRVGSKLDVSLPGVKFYNNTFYDCGNYSDAFHVINFNHSIYGFATDCEMIGNIFALCGADPSSKAQGWFGVDDPYDTRVRDTLVARNNLITGSNWSPKTGNMGLNAANGVNPRFIFAPKVRRKIALSGTTAVNNSTTVIGSGTTFLTDLIVGDYIMLGPRFTNTPVRVESITSNTQLTVASPIGDGTTKKIIRVQNFDRPFDLHITRNDASVAVNPPVSVVSVDFDGTARPQGILPEMGAYEYSGQLSVIQSPTGVRISP